MKKTCFLLLFTLFSIFSFTQTIEGKWLFESIRFEQDTTGKNLKPIAVGDFMLINSDGAFSYELSKLEQVLADNFI